MWLRTSGIIFCKWLTQFLGVMVFVNVVPRAQGYGIAIPAWILSVLVSAAYCFWLFHKEIPAKRELILILVLWLIETFVLMAFLSWYVFDTVLPVVNSLEVYVGFLVEIATVFVMTMFMRRHLAMRVYGEGLSE